MRERKLLDVSRFFQLAYRTVIPNRPPTISSDTNSLPIGLSTFNPRPLGKNFILIIISKIKISFSGREIARSFNNFIGQWRT